MNIDKIFDKNLDITTKEGKTYHIEKKETYIHGYSSFIGEAKVMLKDNNLYVLKEVYSYDNNRLRYSYNKYENVKAFNSYEKCIDGTEKPILVIENYEKMNTYIGSIGNITKINSDKLDQINENTKEKPLILKLLKKNKKNENNEIDKLLAA